MAIKTISLEVDAYEKLRRAKREPRESFSSVVRRAKWEETSPAAGELMRDLQLLCRENPEVLLPPEVLRALTHSADSACSCRNAPLITWMEFAEGYPAEKEEACRLFLSRFRVIIPDLAIAWRASRIWRHLRQRGSPVGDHDVWIAATALERKLPLVTRNPRRFGGVEELEIQSY